MKNKIKEINLFFKSFYYGTNVRHDFIVTVRMRQRIKKYIKFVKKLYNKNWRGLNLINIKRERKLNQLEEQLSRLF